MSDKKEWTEVTDKNSADIAEIKSDINTIKTNHLHHLEKDVSSLHKKIEKMDTRIWAILIMLVASGILGMLRGG